MKKMFSKTRANASLAYCYIEECVNQPETKLFRYYHWDKKKGMYARRTFLMEEALLVSYLMYLHPDFLTELLDKGQLYSYVMRKVREYNKAVDHQTELLCKSDEEMQLALLSGDTERYSELERNNRQKAEEMVRTILYAA